MCIFYFWHLITATAASFTLGISATKSDSTVYFSHCFISACTKVDIHIMLLPFSLIICWTMTNSVILQNKAIGILYFLPANPIKRSKQRIKALLMFGAQTQSNLTDNVSQRLKSWCEGVDHLVVAVNIHPDANFKNAQNYFLAATINVYFYITVHVCCIF